MEHKLVPSSVKESISPFITFVNEWNKDDVAFKSQQINVTHFIPSNIHAGATQKEITDWLARYSHKSVLRFTSLDGPFDISISTQIPSFTTTAWKPPEPM